MAAPAAASDAEAALWWDWMPSSWIGFDGPMDPVPESWDFPSIQGDWVVWQKTADAALDWNIEAYNIRTRQTKTVSAATGHQAYPSVYGNWVVYMDNRTPGNLEIYAYNLSTGVERRLTNTPAVQEYMPDISGTKVVFFSTAGDVWVHDLATGATTPLPLGAGAQFFARISGDRVVYQESNDIFVYDLRSGVISRLTNDGVADAFPDIDGTLVA
jgi:beta propeller repeat protein